MDTPIKTRKTVALVLNRGDGQPVTTAFRRTALGRDDPLARHREVAWEGRGDMAAGRATFIGELEVDRYPHTETIVVLDGELQLRAEADFEPSSPPPAQTLLGPAPRCRSDNVFTDDKTRCRAGTWDSTGYHRIVRPHPVNEFMHLLAGSVRFECADGTAVTANAGDSVYVPQGEPVGWESTQRVAKYYVVQTVQD
ncbi:MAG TPA: cupin domain-containing protein [Ramlibacter sp.]|uniref:cupin domain-containing protein n=1 Tax=Ramlibacter sp. TaxID=1917967 RepID=UPI002B89C634|nr:cupin domain-containing protein [Ramlibacter sp.]HVZ44849.1 cupin domain-containing protein [Ramlibacter sp.]